LLLCHGAGAVRAAAGAKCSVVDKTRTRLAASPSAPPPHALEACDHWAAEGLAGRDRQAAGFQFMARPYIGPSGPRACDRKPAQKGTLL